MSLQEVSVIFQNSVDLQVFERSPSEFLVSLTQGARGVEVSGKTANRVIYDIYGCNAPSSELTGETVLNFQRQKHIADYSATALQTLGEFVQWRLEKKTKEHSEKLLKWSGINDDTREETADLAISTLQYKFREKSIASCALAACFLFPSSLNHKFRSLLQVASIQVQKNTARSWIRKTYPEVSIKPSKSTPEELFKKVAIAILLRHKSRALNTRLAFWAPPALI